SSTAERRGSSSSSTATERYAKGAVIREIRITAPFGVRGSADPEHRLQPDEPVDAPLAVLVADAREAPSAERHGGVLRVLMVDVHVAGVDLLRHLIRVLLVLA